MMLNCYTSVVLFSSFSSIPSLGFVPPSTLHGRPTLASRPPSLYQTSTDDDTKTLVVDNTEDENDVVRAPLRFLGPYPTIPLRFPNLATASQRDRNITGVSLDFVLDTAANTNTINAQVAQELSLEKVGQAPGGFGAAGGIMGGDTFMLGDCELDINLGMAKENRAVDEENEGSEEVDKEKFVFMQELTASALPVASPAAAGLLSLAFFYCFEGGVEFIWGDSANPVPSVTFYGSDKHLNLDGMTCVPFDSIEGTMLPSVTLCVNGVEIPALFDTGSPITVLNARAAEKAGIATAIPMEDLDPEKQSKKDGKGGSWNPFSKLAANVQSASQIAQATTRGEILTIAGTNGKPVYLVKSESPLELQVASKAEQSASSQTKYTKLGENNVFVGDLPGLAALGGLGGDAAPPAAVLGMDFLRCRPKIVFRAQQNEIYL